MTSSRCCNTTNSTQPSAISIQPERVRAWLALWLVVVLLALPASSRADDRPQAVALVNRAVAASRLSDLKGAYTLKISFRVPGEHGTEGTFQYWSVSPGHWRREIK